GASRWPTSVQPAVAEGRRTQLRRGRQESRSRRPWPRGSATTAAWPSRHGDPAPAGLAARMWSSASFAASFWRWVVTDPRRSVTTDENQLVLKRGVDRLVVCLEAGAVTED